MQSEQSAPKPMPRHRRSQSSTLGKTMPVTSLLLNFPPPTLATFRSQDIGDRQDRPPMFFTVPDVRVEEQPPAEDDHEKDYDLMVSDSDEERHPGSDDDGAPRSGCLKRYTPCLTCTNMAPPALAARDSAINEMCRRFCTDECRRMRLSLAGYLLEAPQTPPPPPPSPAMDRREEAQGGKRLNREEGRGNEISEREEEKDDQKAEEEERPSERKESGQLEGPKGHNEEEMKGVEQEEMTEAEEGAKKGAKLEKKEVSTEEEKGPTEEEKMGHLKEAKKGDLKAGEKEDLIEREEVFKEVLKESPKEEDKEASKEEEKESPKKEEKGAPKVEEKEDLKEEDEAYKAELKEAPKPHHQEALTNEEQEAPQNEVKDSSKEAKEESASKEDQLERSWESPCGEQRRPSDTIRLQRSRFLHDLLQDNEDDDRFEDDVNVKDPHDDERCDLKDFRENNNSSDIAEALAKTSAMTSTTQIKQRLAARKLEFELENALAEAEAAAASARAAMPPAADKLGAADVELWGLAFSNSSNNNNSSNIDRDGAAAAATSSGAKAAATSMLYRESEPPRDLLLYLVRIRLYDDRDQRDVHTFIVIAMLLRKVFWYRRPPSMGSFNSAPKINNMDSQDDGLDIPKGLNTHELLQHFRHLRGIEQPPLLNRYFLKPSMAAQMVSQDITDGLHSLKLNPMTRSCHGPNSIRLLQWNVLSQSLGQNNDGFVCCPEEALTWENRKFLIVQEILQHNPDIICLQEVDHFKFLQTILGTQNYRGIFFPKPDSPCLYIEENNGPDGCAIFFKSDKFELQHCETRILEVWRVQSNQVAIAVNLRMRSNGAELCVCTTHLKARHGSLLSKMRNEQGRDLLRFVKSAAGDRAVLLCGDFNAEPTEPVYSTVLNCDILRLASAYADIKQGAEQRNDTNDNVKQRLANGGGEPAVVVAAKEEEDELLSAGELSGSTSDSDNVDGGEMSSGVHGNRADAVQQSIRREPAYTTWKIREDGEVCHTIDYVFYSKDHFKINNCLEFPLEDEIGKNRTPSFQYPSDHFSLVCDFEVLQKQAQSNEQQQIDEQQQQQQKCKNQ